MPRSRTRFMLLVFATIVAIAGSACGEGTNTQPASPGDGIPEVLDFEAPLLGGDTFRGAPLAGKDVAFWFWAPW